MQSSTIGLQRFMVSHIQIMEACVEYFISKVMGVTGFMAKPDSFASHSRCIQQILRLLLFFSGLYEPAVFYAELIAGSKY